MHMKHKVNFILILIECKEFSSITKVQIRGTMRICSLPQSQSFPSYRIYLHALNHIGPDRVEDMTLTVSTDNFFFKKNDYRTREGLPTYLINMRIRCA